MPYVLLDNFDPSASVGLNWSFILYVMGSLWICCVKSLPHSEDGEMLHLLYELIHQVLFICSITFPQDFMFCIKPYNYVEGEN